jgi:hypothetical protein
MNTPCKQSLTEKKLLIVLSSQLRASCRLAFLPTLIRPTLLTTPTIIFFRKHHQARRATASADIEINIYTTDPKNGSGIECAGSPYTAKRTVQR